MSVADKRPHLRRLAQHFKILSSMNDFHVVADEQPHLIIHFCNFLKTAYLEYVLPLWINMLAFLKSFLASF